MATATNNDGGTGCATRKPTAGAPDVPVRRTGSAALKLETPVLRFSEVPAGHSQSQAIVVGTAGPGPIDLGVLAPPLAPFSVVERLGGDRSPSTDDRTTAKIWIRYDANSPMANDSGRITIVDRTTGLQWTVALDGSGSLATVDDARNDAIGRETGRTS